MSTSKDMAECELRNAQGYPRHHGPTTRPRATVRSGRAPLTANVDQSVDNSNNKALPWFSAGMSGAAFGGLILLAILQPWRTEDRASKAELRAELATEVARAVALAELARKEASTAKDMVDLDRAKAKAKEELNNVRR